MAGTEPFHLLNIVSDRDVAQRVNEVIAGIRPEFDARAAATPEEYRAALASPFDLVVADHGAADLGCAEALQLAREHDQDLPFVLVNGTLPREEADRLLAQGVYDYVSEEQLGALRRVVGRVERERALRRRVREAEAARRASEAQQQALLASLRDHVAVLDEHGEIVAVNEAWRTFARANGDAELKGTNVGSNYFDVCQRAAREGDREARVVHEGLRRVLFGEAPLFEHAYPCHAPDRKRWFQLQAVPLAGERRGLVVTHRNDTERRRALQAASRSETLAHDIVMSAGAGLLVLRVVRGQDGAVAEFECTQANAAAAALLGGEPTWCEGRRLSELLGDGWMVRLDDLCRQAAETTEVAEAELTTVEDGATRYLQVTVLPVGGHVALRLRDVTEERCREEKLEDVVERFEMLSDNVPGMVFEVHVQVREDAENIPTFTYVSAGCRALFGIEPQAALADPSAVLGYIHPDDLADLMTSAAEAAEAMDQWETTVRAQVGDATKWLHVVASPRTTAPDARVWDGLVIDVTERRHADEYQRRLAAIVEGSNDAIIGCRANGIITSWNRTAERLLGYRADEIVGQSLRQLVPEDRRHELQRVFAPEEDQITQQFDSVALHKDGKHLDVSVTVSKVEDRASRRGGISLIVRDITMRKRFVREVLAAKQKAKEMNRLKSAFLANMSHEIRTPLTGIIGFADLLDEVVNEEHREFTGYIRQNSERLLETLTSVLELAEIDSGSYDYEAYVVQLGEVIEQRVEAFTLRARQQGLDLSFNGTAARDVYVAVDKEALEHVLHQLLSNAVKFTPEGHVCVEVRADATHAEVRVIDTGVGMSREFHQRAFREFSQESMGEDRAFQGSGLGLAIVKRLTEMMGGTVSIESERGRGTTVTLRLIRAETSAAPAPPKSEADAGPDAPDRAGGYQHDALVTTDETASAAPVAAPPPASARQAESAAPHDQPSDAAAGGRPRILVVDDERSTRTLLKLMLADEYDVEVASGMAEAEELARAQSFALFILDINLGERQTGVELMRALRTQAAYERTPMIACTAYALRGDAERFLQAGFQGYLGKPVSKEALLEAVAEALEADVDPLTAAEEKDDLDVALPPLPGTLPVIVELLGQEQPDVERLEQTLESDPVAASWVLRRVNSAYYGLRQDIHTIGRAVTLLGFEPVCDLVLMEVLSRSFSDLDGKSTRAVYERLVRSSVVTAALARRMSDVLSVAEPGKAFAAGMLHQVGRLALLSHDPAGYTALWQNPGGADELQAPSLQDELRRFETDHVEVGKRVMQQWELPSMLQAPVLFYERPSRARAHPRRRLVLLIAAAHHFASRLLAPDGPPRRLTVEDGGEAFRALAGLTDRGASELPALLDEASEEALALADVAFHHA